MKHGTGTLIFFVLIALLILTHASSFAAAVTAVGGQTYNETNLLSGSGAGHSTATQSTGAGKYSISGS